MGGEKGKGFAVAREIRGYRMGLAGRLCPATTTVLFQEDCQYALQQFTDSTADVPMDTYVNDPSVPAGCSYNTELHRGQWNSVVDNFLTYGEGRSDMESICYNKDDVSITPQKGNCHHDWIKHWDVWCCGWGTEPCPSGYQDFGIYADENNWLRMYRKCYKNVCNCPSDTREYVTVLGGEWEDDKYWLADQQEFPKSRSFFPIYSTARS